MYLRRKRPIEARANAITEEQRTIARQFGQYFLDGARLHGYRECHYNPRFWQATVKRFRDYDNLAEDASLLDVGCGKGFMLYDVQQRMPTLAIAGLDISGYAIANAMEKVKPFVQVGNAKSLPYRDNSFDL